MISNKSVEVLPAIIPESFDDLKDKMSLVNGIVPAVQVDVCDGKFVPSKSWPYIGDEENDFEKMQDEESEGFPFWQTLDFEADLMVKMTQEIAEKWIRVGAKRIILHLESAPDIFEIIKKLREEYGYPVDSAVSIEIGLAINIDTSNEELDKYLFKNDEEKDLVDFVQFMGINKIGYQGQEFDENVLDKIAELREKYPDLTIAVDGGVNFDTAGDLKDVGVNKLVSGSALYESENIKEAIEEMKNI